MQCRTGSVLGSFLGCLAIAGLGLWIIFAIAKSSDSPKSSPDTPRRTSPARRATGEDSAPTHSALDPTELKRLAQQRQYAVEMLAAIDSILKAPSFAVRAERYCRFTVDQVEALAMPADKGVEERYRQLLHEEPITREGEVNRQQSLATMERLVARHRENLRQCESLVTMGMQRMPSEAELREKADQAESEIAEIDRRIAGPAGSPNPSSNFSTARSESRTVAPPVPPSGPVGAAPSPLSLPIDPPSPSSVASSQPVLLNRVEPEYSEEARRAQFNGDIHASIVIDDKGNIADVRVLDSPGFGLDERVVAAVRQWKFKPALKDGVPVWSQGTVTLTFRRF